MHKYVLWVPMKLLVPKMFYDQIKFRNPSVQKQGGKTTENL